MSKLNWRTSYSVFLLCVATAIASQAQTLTTLFRFDWSDGANPNAALFQATDGNFYGTAENGSSKSNGTVFKVTPDGVLTTVYKFCSELDCLDGEYPRGGVIQGLDGNFYGVTSNGGANALGIVFKVTYGGTLTTLHSFCSETKCADGAQPLAGLIQGTDGNFYGTIWAGGTGRSCFPPASNVGSVVPAQSVTGCGTVFKINPGGELTTLYDFCAQGDCADGYAPEVPLIEADDGSFYGTTSYGGITTGSCGVDGCGTIFKITPDGTLATLHSFHGTDGATPQAIIQATDGNFYGTTFLGGTNGGGTVFRITPQGTLTTLYSFCKEASCPDGAGAEGLVEGTDGNFYGLSNGSPTAACQSGCGAIFEITPSGTFTTIYSFCSQSDCADGEYPSGLTQGTDGNFYGVTYSGGDTLGCGGPSYCGTVFRLSLGLGPFIKMQPAAAKVGATVKILGTNLIGASSVTFDGTPAPFTVESGSYIKTMVPAGATTGTVQVVTPTGTLSSSVPFRVAP
jgi:uncharacterized repeat protein (TIGR03803 family)